MKYHGYEIKRIDAYQQCRGDVFNKAYEVRLHDGDPIATFWSLGDAKRYIDEQTITTKRVYIA